MSQFPSRQTNRAFERPLAPPGPGATESIRRFHDLHERFGALACLVNVDRPAEALDLVDRVAMSGPRRSEREAAFRGFADAHLDRAYRLARAILRNETEAQDATHD